MSIEFFEFLERFKGRKVARCWFGDSSIMYLEFGKVIGTNRNHPSHEHHIFLGYDWQLALANGDSVERLARNDSFVEQLLCDQIISKLSLTKDQNLLIEFSNGSRLESRSNESEEPDWDVREFDRFASIDGGKYNVKS